MRYILLFISLTLLSCMVHPTFTDSELGIIGQSGDTTAMRVYTINNYSDSVLLRQIAEKLTPEDMSSDTYETLKRRMLTTVLDTANPGVGIAAPQVGISRRLIAVQRLDKDGQPFEVYANPKIERLSDEILLSPEGCLSVIGYDTVKRHKEVVVSWDDPVDQKRITETITGFTAIIFQHEIDHLDGIIYTDRK